MKELNEMELREVEGGFLVLLGLLIPTALQVFVISSLASGVIASFKAGYEAVQ